MNGSGDGFNFVRGDRIGILLYNRMPRLCHQAVAGAHRAPPTPSCPCPLKRAFYDIVTRQAGQGD